MKTLSYLKAFIAGMVIYMFIPSMSSAQDQPWWNSQVKYPTNRPIIEGEVGTFWQNTLAAPVVIYDNNIFKMWITGGQRGELEVAYGWSRDGNN